MPSVRRKDYDDDELVAAIASGSKPHSQVARDFGLSPTMVHYIVKGRKRPELRPRIEAATAGLRDRAQRLLAQVAAPAVARLSKLMGDDDQAKPEIQLKAAVELLNFALGKPFRAAAPAGEIFAMDPLASAVEEAAFVAGGDSSADREWAAAVAGAAARPGQASERARPGRGRA